MANVPETSTWESGVYQFETTDLIQGGPGGTDNIPHQQLGNRTKWLYDNKLSRDGSQNMTGGLAIQPAAGDALNIATPAGVDSVIRVTKAGQTAVTFKAINSGVLTIGVDTAAGNTERMRFDSSGNVGIGAAPGFYTAAGRTELAINGPTSSLIGFATGGAARGYMVGYSDHVELGSSGFTSFVTGGAERLRIDASGKVGVGIATPAVLMHAFSPFGGPSPSIQIETGGSSDAAFRSKTTLGSWGSGTGIGVAANCWNVYDFNAAVERMRIDASGNLGVGSAPIGTGANRTSISVNGVASAFFGLGVAGSLIGGLYGDAGLLSLGTATGAMTFSTVNTERARFDASGNFGIGGAPLGIGANRVSVSVNGSVSSFFGLGVAGSLIGGVYADSGILSLGSSVSLVFSTADVERMRINPSGAVSIVGSLSHATPSAGATGTESVTAAWVLAKAYVTAAGAAAAAPVQSVAGKTGAVTLNTNDVGEASNLYFTNARAQAAALAQFTQSHATNGYVKLPNGTIFQWGQGTPPSVSHQDWSVSFPIAFPNACLSVVNSDICPGSNGGYENANRVKSFSSSGVTFRQDWIGDSENGDTKQTTTSWHAIGY